MNKIYYKKFCLIMETSSTKGALGLYSFKSKTLGIKPIQIKTWTGDHSACLNPAFESFFVKKLWKKPLLTRKTLAKNTFLALGVGPGRFTGTRVGVSFAKSLNFISHVPIYPVSSLKILAESQFESTNRSILVLMNAFRNSLYMALYQKKEGRLKERIAPCVVLPKDLEHQIKTECVCIGDGYRVYEELMPLSLKRKMAICKECVVPEIPFFARLLQREFDPSGLRDWRALAPLYLRSPVPTLHSQKV